jgi:hypothetical protein
MPFRLYLQEDSFMLGVSSLFVLLLTGFQDLSVQVQQLQNSKPENVTWVSISSDGLTVRSNGQVNTVPLTSLKLLQFNNSPLVASHELGVVLADGSRFTPSQVLTQGQAVQLQVSESRSFTIPTKFVRSVQFQKLNDIQQTQWRAIQDSRVAGDTLVVVRSAEALDKVEGIVGEIEADKVKFEFSQQKIDAPRPKLAGIKFFNPTIRNKRVMAVVSDLFGNTLQVHQLTSEGDRAIRAELACGAELVLQLSELHTIDFSVGSVQYVAELSPIGGSRTGGFALKVQIPGSEQLFGAQSVRLPQTNGPSLRMVGSGSVTYRVPDEYQKLVGKVSLAPDGQQFTPSTVQIKLENQTVWEGKLADLSQRLDFDLKVQPDQRVQFVLQTDAKYPVGDVVVWHELRMLK